MLNNNSNESDREGISLLCDFLNNGNFNLLLDFNNPQSNAIKTIALFLFLIETGQAYQMLLEKFKIELDRQDDNIKKIIESIFERKKYLEETLDLPAILPRDVFQKLTQGV